MATTKRPSRLSAEALWGHLEQVHRCRGEIVVHTFPLHGPDHVLEGYPLARCWCDASVDMQKDGFIVNHRQLQ